MSYSDDYVSVDLAITCRKFRNVCTLYSCLSAIPATMTSDLKQRLIVTWASVSQNVIDEAVGQWTKRLRAGMRQKEITLNMS